MTHHQPVALPQGAVVQHQMGIEQPVSTSMPVTNPSQPGNWGGIKVTGIMQIVLGGLIIILGIVSFAVDRFSFIYMMFASPIWFGLLFCIVAGILGTVAGQQRNNCVAIAYMIMSIFASPAAFVVVYLSAGNVVVAAVCRDNFNTSYGCWGTGDLLAVDIMLLILSITEFIVSIVGASMCCCGTVCCNETAKTVVHYQGQAQVVVADQPQVYYPGQVAQQQFAPYVVQVPQQQFGSVPAYSVQQACSAPPQGKVQPPPPECDSFATAEPHTQNMSQPLIM